MSKVIRYNDIDEVTNKPMYEICDYCNYSEHMCHWCGDFLTHSSHDLEGNLHDTAYCRPDLVGHEPGEICTWPRTGECYWDHEKGELK